ncbi:hypothetical protein V1264_021106 [Littorina saxatilis]|uniref:Uncharacterized protein n=1 Tax=Littorina saxatilis TaxID=31220 RepID=A0AAN9BBH8_9CAEN
MEDEEFSISVCKLAALAFVPTPELSVCYDHLQETIADDRFQQVADYLEDTYIGRRVGRNARRRNPLFPSEMWNQYERTDDDMPRTNNHCEGWHRRFQSNVGAHHPNFWKFLEVLRREEAAGRAEIAQHIAGHPPPPKRRKYKDSNERILRLVRSYDNRNRDTYLLGIAHNVFF